MRNRAEDVSLHGMVRQACKAQSISSREIASALKISESLFSRALRGQRKLDESQLRKIADKLGLEPNAVLLAGGFRPSADSPQIYYPDVLPVLATGGPPIHVRVVTHRDYVDSAFLQWLLMQQPLRRVGVQFDFQEVSWRDIPVRLVGPGNDYAIGVCNKRIQPALIAAQLEFWADLCLYTGYALLGHASDLPKGQSWRSARSMSDACTLIHQLKKRCAREGRTPLIVAMSTSTIRRLQTALSSGLLSEEWVQEIRSSEAAVTLFKKGKCDLFVGGLAERLTLARDDRFVEVLHNGIDPFLVSLASLFASKTLVSERRGIVQAITSLWYDTVQRMQSNRQFLRAVAQGVSDSSRQPTFAGLLEAIISRDNHYMVFADRPGALDSAAFDVLVRAAASSKMTPPQFVSRARSAFDVFPPTKHS